MKNIKTKIAGGLTALALSGLALIGCPEQPKAEAELPKVESIKSEQIDYFAEFQMKDDTYWSPCENCINVNCIKTEDFPMWFCPYQE